MKLTNLNYTLPSTPESCLSITKLGPHIGASTPFPSRAPAATLRFQQTTLSY